VYSLPPVRRVRNSSTQHNLEQLLELLNLWHPAMTTAVPAGPLTSCNTFVTSVVPAQLLPWCI